MTTKTSFPEPHDDPQDDLDARLAAFLQQFNADFPSEEHCREELMLRLSSNGTFQCRHCGGKSQERQFASRVALCSNCKQDIWITAGTFFHHVRRVRPWLIGISLIEHRITINSYQFQKLAGVAYATAWNIFMKLTIVMKNKMDDNTQVVPSSHFSPLFCRRSRETPARLHPLAEQHEIDKSMLDGQCNDKAEPGNESSSLPGYVPCTTETGGKADSEKRAGTDSVIDTEAEQTGNGSGLAGEEKQLFDLMAGGDMHIDLLCLRSGLHIGTVASTLTFMELQGLVVRLAGDRYAHAASGSVQSSATRAAHAAPTDQAQAMVESIIEFVRRHCQGISRKYLQNYLALHWCQIDRACLHPGALFKACLAFKPVIIDEILKYVTPPEVMMVACRP